MQIREKSDRRSALFDDRGERKEEEIHFPWGESGGYKREVCGRLCRSSPLDGGSYRPSIHAEQRHQSSRAEGGPRPLLLFCAVSEMHVRLVRFQNIMHEENYIYIILGALGKEKETLRLRLSFPGHLSTVSRRRGFPAGEKAGFFRPAFLLSPKTASGRTDGEKEEEGGRRDLWSLLELGEKWKKGGLEGKGEGGRGMGRKRGGTANNSTTRRKSSFLSCDLHPSCSFFFAVWNCEPVRNTVQRRGPPPQHVCSKRRRGREWEKRREKKSLSSLLLRAAAVLRNNCCRLVRWRLRGPLMGTFPPHYYRHVVKILVVWVFRVIIFDEKKTRRNNCGTCPTWKNRQKQTHW